MSVSGIVTPPPAPPSAMPPFGLSEIRKRTQAVQEVMRGVMKEGTHFGTIPGTPKPSLWKAGAEVLCLTFRLAPLLESQVTVDDPEGEWGYTSFKRDGSIVNGTCVGFFEVEASCTIQGPPGVVLSRCSARCNNREAKYRSLSMFEIRNTIQKMAEKRAFVSAVLMATGASDIFTQDLEDMPDLAERQNPVTPAHLKTTAKGLSPKREAWLLKAATAAGLTEKDQSLCQNYLSECSVREVSDFFDALARKGLEVFIPFKSAT